VAEVKLRVPWRRPRYSCNTCATSGHTFAGHRRLHGPVLLVITPIAGLVAAQRHMAITDALISLRTAAS